MNPLPYKPAVEAEIGDESTRLAALQRVLARCYTDAAFRDRFGENPVPVGAEHGLAADTARALADSGFEEIGYFARSLHRKRLSEASSYLPLTGRALGRDFAGLFMRYAESPLPPATNRPVADAIRFATFLATKDAQGGLEPNWVSDLARYEAAPLSVRFGLRRIAVQRFRFRVDELAKSLAGADPVVNRPEAGAFVGVWLGLGRSGRARNFVIALPRRRLSAESLIKLVAQGGDK